MARTGGHKALVPVSDAEWRAFHALAVSSGTTIAAELARLVRSAIGVAGPFERELLEGMTPGQNTIDDEISSSSSTPARRPAKRKPAAGKVKPAKPAKHPQRASRRGRTGK